MAEKGEPTVFESGEGVRVTDVQGNTYIDAMSGLWLKNIGYGRKEVADAAYEQMLKLTYMPMGTTTEPTIRLAEKVAELTPGDLSRSFFTSGGSESVETAIKLSRAYFKRDRRAGPHQVHQPQGLLPRRHRRSHGPGRQPPVPPV